MHKWEYHKPYVVFRDKKFRWWFSVHEFDSLFFHVYLRHGVDYSNRVTWLWFDFGWLNRN